jgi:hypothetical protein
MLRRWSEALHPGSLPLRVWRQNGAGGAHLIERIHGEDPALTITHAAIEPERPMPARQ